MSTFVLVHGAWHGAWCWYKVIPRLEASGHTTVAVDLPGLGADPTPLADVTMDLWNAHLAAVIEAQTEPVILVGHSRGGLNITFMALVGQVGRAVGPDEDGDASLGYPFETLEYLGRR